MYSLCALCVNSDVGIHTLGLICRVSGAVSLAVSFRARSGSRGARVASATVEPGERFSNVATRMA